MHRISAGPTRLSPGIRRGSLLIAALTLATSASADSSPSATDLDAFRSAIISGGPPKDGIPSIDEPQFTSAAAASHLEDDDIVFGIVRNGQARAYPRRILASHEIVNDRLGGRNLAVTYCPLTATAIGFYRGNTTFGVSGRLVNSNLVMYDRKTGSYWPQMLATAIKGPRQGEQLESFPVAWTSWKAWREAHPDTRVMTRNTGYARDYSRDPYGSYNPLSGYYAPGTSLMFPVMNKDDRLADKAIVVTALSPDGALAVDKDRLRSKGAIVIEAGAGHYLAVHDPALETGRIYRLPGGSDVEPADIGLTAQGLVANGDPVGGERLIAWDAFWFAWAAFYPQTALAK